jgi:hypothetical protein
MNEYVVLDAVDPFGQMTGPSYRNKYMLKRPAATITNFIGADTLSPALTSDHTHSRLWFLPAPNVPWGTLRIDIQPDRFAVHKVPDNTAGSSLFLYADGRVENVKAQAVKDMADRWEDFSKPPDR